MNNEGIFFDTNSGISIEEQKDILSEINGITEKNKKSLLDAAAELQSSEKITQAAKKKSAFFPLAVNIAALAVLAAGALSLFIYNSRKDFQIRTGTGSYTIAGQAVIGELTHAQQEALETLRALTSEQERAAGIDAYLSGAITVVTDLLLNDQFDDAAVSISELKVFLNTPSFELNRTFLSRKEFYIQSINSLEKLIEDIRRSGYSVVMALEEKNEELENTVLQMQTSVETLTARNTEQAARITQLQDTVSEKDASISSLENERNNLTQTVSGLRAENADKEAQITQLAEQLANIRAALQALSQ